MIVSQWSRLKLGWVLVAAVAVFSTARCSDDARAPTSPTGAVGSVSGLVRGEAPMISRIAYPHPVLANATVTVIGGPASGSKTATRDDGTFELKAAGSFKLRFEHPNFVTSESPETTMTAAGVAIPEMILRTAPWSLSGRVTDSRGTPVPDAEVMVALDTYSREYGRTRTDAAGRYVFTSTLPRFESMFVVPTKPGFQPLQQVSAVRCCGEVPDIRIIRIVSITPTAPTSLRVGESVEMPASTVVFDTGETRHIFVLPTSGASSVVDVSRSSHWYAMRGVGAGVTTLTFDLWGAVATMQVHVR